MAARDAIQPKACGILLSLACILVFLGALAQEVPVHQLHKLVELYFNIPVWLAHKFMNATCLKLNTASCSRKLPYCARQSACSITRGVFWNALLVGVHT